jgi:hypothetical protein
MAKSHAQIEDERKQRIEERRRYLIENPEVYQRDFDEVFKRYLARNHPELDHEDCDYRFDPHYKKEFIEDRSDEVMDLCLKYNLGYPWDPDGDDPPDTFIGSVVRKIRSQDERIWLNQIREDSIINLPPAKTLGKFLIAEIDLSKPRNQIKADIMGLVDRGRKKLNVTGSYRELISPPEPRNREGSYTYGKMEVWKMVQKERKNRNEPEGDILTRIAQQKCLTEGITPLFKYDGLYGKIKEDKDPIYQERKNEIRKALNNSYERDKRLYYG